MARIFKNPAEQSQSFQNSDILERIKKIPSDVFNKLQWNIHNRINMGTEGDYTEEDYPYMSPEDYLDSYDVEQLQGPEGLVTYLKEIGY